MQSVSRCLWRAFLFQMSLNNKFNFSKHHINCVINVNKTTSINSLSPLGRTVCRQSSVSSIMISSFCRLLSVFCFVLPCVFEPSLLVESAEWIHHQWNSTIKEVCHNTCTHCGCHFAQILMISFESRYFSPQWSILAASIQYIHSKSL